MVKRLLLVLITFSVCLPLFARIISEIPASQPVYGSAPSEQSSGVIGANGDGFLAVWMDQRQFQYQLYAARLSSSGEVLDPTGIRIGNNRDEVNVAPINVLFIDDTWVVLWNAQRFEPDSTRLAIEAVRMDRDGHIIDGPRVVLDNAQYAVPRGAATNGSRIVVAYGDHYAILDDKLNVIERDIRLFSGSSQNFAARVASNGSTFAIAWTGATGVNYQSNIMLLDSSGHQNAQVRGAGQESAVGVASDGGSYLLVTGAIAERPLFRARRITSTVEALDVPPPLPAPPGIVTGADLIWMGNSYLLVTGDTVAPAQRLDGIRIDTSGKAIDDQTIVVSDPAFGGRTLNPSAAFNGRQLATLWHSGASPDNIDVYATLLDPVSLHRSNPILMSMSTTPQYTPALGFSGRNYLAAWNQSNGLFVGRMSLDGQTLDGAGVRLSPTGGTPRVIFDGTNYVVAWMAYTFVNSLGTLWVDRISPDGVVLDGEGIPIVNGPCPFNFDLASNGATSLVAWDDCGFTGVRVKRLNDAARPIDAGVLITPAGSRFGLPAIAWNGREWLVAFQQQNPYSLPGVLISPAPIVYRGNVYAARLTSELTVLDTQPIEIAVSDKTDQSGIRAASNGTDFLITWTRSSFLDLTPPFPSEVRARRMTSDGSLDDVAVLAPGVVSSTVWDGARYAVAFSHAGDALLTHAGIGDLQVISATADDESAPKLVAIGGGDVTAIYSRVATESLYGGVPRAFVRQPTPARQRTVHGR